MTEQALGQFLSDEERIALNIERTRSIAEALSTHIEMLMKMGVPDEGIKPSVDQLRNHLSTRSRKEIKKIHKGILEAASKMPAIALGEGLPEPAIAGEVEVSLETAVTPELESTIVEEDTLPESLSIAPESVEVPEAEEEPVVPQPDETAEEELVIDERKPKRLSKSLNNAFGKSYTYGQRMVMSELDDEQQKQFAKLLQNIAETHGSKLIQRNAELYAKMLDHLLKGRSVREVGELVGIAGPTVSYTFRDILPPFIHEHKRVFVEGYTEILAATPELLERAKEVRSPENELALAVEQKPKHEKIAHPEGVSHNIDNALIRVLDFEQRAAISEFTKAQQDELIFLIDKILSKDESMRDDKDKWVGRFEQLLGGVAVRQISSLEGLPSSLGIVQGFSTKIPRILAEYKDEFIAEFEEIRAGNFETRQETEPAPEADATAGTATTEQEQSEDLPNEAPEAVAEVTNDIAPEDEPTVEIAIEPEALTAEEPVVVEAAVPEQQEAEQAPAEPLVELMQKAFSNEDPIALQAINELFTVQRETQTNEGTIEAARYLSAMIRAKGINLSISLEGNTKAKVIVENMLEGRVTLSEALNMTPEDFRASKQRAIEAAFKKIAGMLEGERSVPSDSRELQVAELRKELHKYIGVSPEVTSQVIDRIVEKNDEFTSELGKALLFFGREAVEAGPKETELKIIRWFTAPQPGRTPYTVAEISTMLTQEQVASRNGSSQQYDNTYVTGTLVRLSGRIINQRKD